MTDQANVDTDSITDGWEPADDRQRDDVGPDVGYPRQSDERPETVDWVSGDQGGDDAGECGADQFDGFTEAEVADAERAVDFFAAPKTDITALILPARDNIFHSLVGVVAMPVVRRGGQ